MVLPGGCRYTTPPEPGTVMGPMYTREFVVVLGTFDGLTLFSYAQQDDLLRAGGYVRSQAEHDAARIRRAQGQ